jgi:hypothetical protein
MPTTVQIELPDGAYSALRRSPDELAQEMRCAAAFKWYEVGELSQEKAAAFAGLSREAFIEAIHGFGGSAIQTRPEELAEEVRAARGSGE